MNAEKVDSWPEILFGAAMLFLLFRAWSGWRQGVVRQGLGIVALVCAYGVAFFGGRHLVPLLRPLGYPDQILAIFGGAALGLFAFVGISTFSAILFKKTSDQSVGLIKLAYGGLGALLGVGFGLVMIWVGMLGIRVLGTLAESPAGPHSATSQRVGATREAANPRAPSGIQTGLVAMKHALESGPAGAVLEHVDPVPEKVYSTMSKLGQVISSERGIERFQGYPGVRALMRNPKLQALQQDPTVARAALDRDYFALMRNPRIVELANDPEIGVLLRGLEFEKALDYALVKPENRSLRPTGE